MSCAPDSIPAHRGFFAGRSHLAPVCIGSRVSIHAAAAVAFLALVACADKPPMPTADTSCERFRYVSANDAQIRVFEQNWDVMESYADQVIANNIEYQRHCLGVAP